MDQIADLLIRIKNAVAVNKYQVTVPFSKMKEAILTILKNDGFISSFEVTSLEDKKVINIIVSMEHRPTHFRRLSKPGRRLYVKSAEIPKPLRGMGTVIVSTSSGVVSGLQARRQGVGGELICEIW